MYRTLRRCAVPFALILLFLLVSTPPALAAPGVGSFHFSDWLDVLARLWAPEGCIIDPGGRCRDGNSATARGEGLPTRLWAPEGCIADPGGRCRDTALLLQRAAGCILDPGGNCAQ